MTQRYRAPEKLIKAIQDHCVRKYSQKKDRFSPVFFAKGAAALSASFTSERNTLPKNYLNLKEYRSGYLLYFTVTNYLKALFCMQEAGIPRSPKEKFKVLDLGTGPGTAVIAALDHFDTNAGGIEITGIDQNNEILKDARELVALYKGSGTPVHFHSATIFPKNLRTILKGGKFDLIFLSNFLSELRTIEERSKIIELLTKEHLSPKGTIIVIEPALRKTTRDLMELRDMVLADTMLPASIVAPCLHHEKCPMIEWNKRDWCHMYLDWERPKLIEDIDKLIGNKKDYLKFSYLILRKEPRKEKPANTYRVVSSTLCSNGKVELLVCNQKGITKLMRLNRDSTEKNNIYGTLKRGDIIELEGGPRLTKETVLKKL